MPLDSLLAQRLHHHKLLQPNLTSPADVVAWLGAVQAQDFPAAKWALSMRVRGGLQDLDVENAFNSGAILRTHVLRPTWHFVAPADLRWLLKLSGPRVHAANAYYYRQAGLDAKVIDRSCAMLQRALARGRFLTRTELAVHLKRARVAADGLKLASIMMHAELEGVICSGPRHGKQFTYALVEGRVPLKGPVLDRERSLAELATRYFRSHGPATLRDFVWWSGLTVKDARAGVSAAGTALVESTIDGRMHWGPPDEIVPAVRGSIAFLLPNYDEYLIAYKDREPVLETGRSANLVARTNGGFAHHLVIDGRLAGGWRRTLKGHAVTIEVAPYKPLTPAQKGAVATAADHYGEFLNQRAELVVV
ncbi:MAG: winged helix DNA-binding domain-containing protein [Vicinamibacterales bacterium]